MFGASGEVAKARSLALHITHGGLLVKRIKLEQGRIIGPLRQLLRFGGRDCEPLLQIGGLVMALHSFAAVSGQMPGKDWRTSID